MQWLMPRVTKARLSGIPGRPDGTPKKQLDVSRLAELGWRARIPFGRGAA